MWTSWGNGSCSNNIWNTNKHQCWTPKEIWSAPELTVIIIQEQLSVFTCMMSCELGMLNSSEARTCSWVAMSCRTTARLIRPSPTTSSYWAGRMCCLITLAAENGGKYSTPSHIYIWYLTCPSLGGNILSMGDILIAPCVSQKVSDGLRLYSFTWALRWTFSSLATFCLLIAVTEKQMGSPATGALSKVKKTAIPLGEPAKWK